jgi:DNA-binding response OmpR family regulator
MPIMRTTPTIIVIDDDQDLRAILQGYLERQGYRVLPAGDGEEGLALARDTGPDLVILDMLMPRLNGFAVLERLKEAGPEAPRVIMLTANDARDHRAYARFLGVDDFLLKPCPLARLLESVQRLAPLPRPGSAPAAV